MKLAELLILPGKDIGEFLPFVDASQPKIKIKPLITINQHINQLAILTYKCLKANISEEVLAQCFDSLVLLAIVE